VTAHTFLFQEGLWTVEGTYFDDSGRPLPLEGKTRVTHFPGLWVSEGAMELKSEGNSLLIHNRYEIIPFEASSPLTTWKSSHPALGELLGLFIVVGDAIISTCLSENGSFSGSDFLLKINDSQYLNRGTFLKGREKLSSWTLELRKIKEGPFPESV